MREDSFFIVGGAGFLGSHFVDRLLGDAATRAVTIFDNFSSGKEWHYREHLGDGRLRIVREDVENLEALTSAMKGHAVVIHLASNPDIARAMVDPDIDFRQGTALTRNVVEAVRLSGASTILYASGSGVYGEIGEEEAREDHGPLIPISTYGASKLAGEALIAAYCHMNGFRARVFRFANVVGRRQTHGVGFDFIRRLLRDPARLAILGDGNQSKSYIHVSDVVEAVLLAGGTGAETFAAYNVATGDYVTVREIACLACLCLGLDPQGVRFEFSGGDRGWKGDVPVIRFDIRKICGLGWNPARNSAQALAEAMAAMLRDIRQGLDDGCLPGQGEGGRP